MKVHVVMESRQYEGSSLVGVGIDLVAALGIATEHCEDAISWSMNDDGVMVGKTEVRASDGVSYEIHEREVRTE